jgi:hypothetical protein
MVATKVSLQLRPFGGRASFDPQATTSVGFLFRDSNTGYTSPAIQSLLTNSRRTYLKNPSKFKTFMGVFSLTKVNSSTKSIQSGKNLLLNKAV